MRGSVARNEVDVTKLMRTWEGDILSHPYLADGGGRNPDSLHAAHDDLCFRAKLAAKHSCLDRPKQPAWVPQRDLRDRSPFVLAEPQNGPAEIVVGKCEIVHRKVSF